MRLFDEILAQKVGIPAGKHAHLIHEHEGLNRLKGVVESAVVFSVDNVTNYLFRHYSDDWHLGEQVPCMAPVNDSMFIETTAPTSNQAWADYFNGVFRSWGILISSERLDGLARDEGVELTPHHEPFQVDASWVLETALFAQMTIHPGRTIGPLTYSTYFLDANGAPVKTTGGAVAGYHQLFHTGKDMMHVIMEDDAAAQDAWENIIQTAHHPLFLAMGFMHCKNVARIENEGRYLSRQAKREAERKDLPKPTKFYTLQIEPMKKVLATEGGIAHNGLKKALHICRGHFSEYSEEKPLFGKYAGRFWIPAHVRGSAEIGIVGKDYAVNPPKDEAAA